VKDSATVPGKEQVQLELPASPQYGRVARIAAAHLALRRGFSLVEIDDLRLVMDEAAVMLLGPGLEAERLEITYGGGVGTVTVDLHVVSQTNIALPVERIERFGALVGELVDSYEIDATDKRLSLTKSRAGAATG
jgi:hypothetical protein